MATYDLTKFTGDVGVNPARAGESRERLVKITWDGTMGANADVIEVMKVPVGCHIVDLMVGSDAVQANTTWDIGYGGNPDYFFASLDSANAVNWPTRANASTFSADPLGLSVGSTPIDEAGYDTIDITVTAGDSAPNAAQISYIYAKWVVADDAP
jgi:hypothetical protein